MSNCIKPVGGQVLGMLDPEHFDYTKLGEIHDVDGNAIIRTKDFFLILKMSKLTTIREWRNFLWNNLQPAVRVNNLRIMCRVKEESDNFKRTLNWEVKFAEVGTERPKDYETWAKIF